MNRLTTVTLATPPRESFRLLKKAMEQQYTWQFTIEGNDRRRRFLIEKRVPYVLLRPPIYALFQVRGSFQDAGEGLTTLQYEVSSEPVFQVIEVVCFFICLVLLVMLMARFISEIPLPWSLIGWLLTGLLLLLTLGYPYVAYTSYRNNLKELDAFISRFARGLGGGKLSSPQPAPPVSKIIDAASEQKARTISISPSESFRLLKNTLATEHPTWHINVEGYNDHLHFVIEKWVRYTLWEGSNLGLSAVFRVTGSFQDTGHHSTSAAYTVSGQPIRQLIKTLSFIGFLVCLMLLENTYFYAPSVSDNWIGHGLLVILLAATVIYPFIAYHSYRKHLKELDAFISAFVQKLNIQKFS